jgi:DNA/RNA endonuclease YhcR with UshA esterase domain
MNRSFFLLVSALGLGVLSCGDPSSPAAGQGDVTAAVYVDRDGSGTLTDGDSTLAGVEVALLRGGQTVETGITGADGLVTFTDLAAGGYQLEVVGSQPQGSVLTSNPLPTASIDVRGTPARVDFRYAFYPGEITGRLFRDDDGSGTFDPAMDTPGAGITIYVRANVDGEPGEILKTMVTDSEGVYLVSPVAPGRYWLEFVNPGALDFGENGAMRMVDVLPDASYVMDVMFTGTFVIPIADARVRPLGSNVVVEGNVTVPPGQFRSGSGGVNSEIWIQDASGGIAIFTVPTADSLLYPLGQLLEVGGTVGAFRGQMQLTSPSVTVREGVTVVTARMRTAAQARTLADDGTLVTVPGLTVTSLGSGTTAFDVNAVDAAGDTLKIRVASGFTGLTRESFVVGSRYNVTGILTQFDGLAQLKVRFASDVQGPMPIATARQQPATTVVTVSGNLTAPPNIFTSGSGGVNSEIWVQDATGGIAVFSVPSANPDGLVLGDLVEVTGTRGAFSGQVQLTSPTVEKLGPNSVVAPMVQTGAQVVALTNDGRLVQVTEVTVTNVPTGTGAAFSVNVTTPDGATFLARVAAANTGLTRTDFVVGETYTMTGLLTNFNGAAQLKLRYASDVVLGSAPPPPPPPPTGAVVVINEIMPDPFAVTDGDGEWLELHNAGDQSIDIQGWRLIGNSAGDTATIQSSLVIPAGGYVVLGRNADQTLNGGVPVDYAYGTTYTMNNSGNDWIVLRNAAGDMVDSVYYGHKPPVGKSLGLRDPSADNSTATSGAETASSNWQVQTSTYGGGDAGTPGAVNDGYIAPTASSASVTAASPASMATSTTSIKQRRAMEGTR